MKAVDEICTIYLLLQRSDLHVSAGIRSNAVLSGNFLVFSPKIIFSANCVIFLLNVDEHLSEFRRLSRKCRGIFQWTFRNLSIPGYTWKFGKLDFGIKFPEFGISACSKSKM